MTLPLRSYGFGLRMVIFLGSLGGPVFALESASLAVQLNADRIIERFRLYQVWNSEVFNFKKPDGRWARVVPHDPLDWGGDLEIPQDRAISMNIPPYVKSFVLPGASLSLGQPVWKPGAEPTPYRLQLKKGWIVVQNLDPKKEIQIDSEGQSPFFLGQGTAWIYRSSGGSQFWLTSGSAKKLNQRLSAPILVHKGNSQVIYDEKRLKKTIQALGSGLWDWIQDNLALDIQKKKGS